MWGRSEDIVRAMRDMDSGFRAVFWKDFAVLENEENDETCTRGIGEYLRKMQTMYMFVRVRRLLGTDNFVLGYMKCERVFSFEPRYRRLYERLRRVSSVVVKAIETAEQREYRLECLGPTNDELDELKAKHPPEHVTSSSCSCKRFSKCEGVHSLWRV